MWVLLNQNLTPRPSWRPSCERDPGRTSIEQLVEPFFIEGHSKSAGMGQPAGVEEPPLLVAIDHRL
jgi:hypothetical protein